MEPTLYKNITDSIAIVIDGNNSMEESLQNSSDDISIASLSDLAMVKNNVLGLLQNTKDKIATLVDGTGSPIRSIIINMQQAVIKQSGSVNSFLSENNLMVKNSFAQLSSDLGYVVDSQYIEADEDSNFIEI